MARILPNLSLKAFFAAGEDGWGNDLDLNFLKLSTLVQGGVISAVDTKPSSPAAGATYLLSASESTHPNNIAVFDNSAWVYFAPQEGWLVFNRDTNRYLHYTGSAWTSLPLPSEKLAALDSLDSTAGVVVQTGANSFSKLAIGATNASDIISRSVGDARYATLAHTHAESVFSFNTRTGAVTLSSGDIGTALGFAPQPADATLTALGGLNSTTGVVEQTGVDIFTKRAIGVSAPTDLLTRANGDSRYVASAPLITALAGMDTTAGVLMQTGPTNFTKRAVDNPANTTSLITLSFGDSRYITFGDNTFSRLTDVPNSFTGKALYNLRVKSSVNGLEFIPPGYQEIATITGTAHTLTMDNAGKQLRCTNSNLVTITIPDNSSVAMPIGTTLSLVQAGTGIIKLITDLAVVLDVPAGRSPETMQNNGYLRLVKHDTNHWSLCGDLAHTMNTQTSDYAIGLEDSYLRMLCPTANQVTVPADLDYPIGGSIIVVQAGVGQTTIVPGSGVTINFSETASLTKQYSSAVITKVATNVWDLRGELEPGV